MNKTVNINLGGTFFHIDEDAYGKLQRYLVAIKKSLSDPEGSEEILKDIESRIAELFSEKLKSPTQVVTLKELDQVIAVMGQPEDYAVDEELFEENPKPKRNYNTGYKQLFRDIDNKYIGGVSAGLGHYLGLDAVWVRLIWILLAFGSGGTIIFAYVLFWILVPAAESTSDKLKMTGEPINISNIEKKFKEGYETVAEKVKNADLDKYGQKVKSSSATFFDTLGNILLTILKIFVKFIGVIVVITAISTLIALIVGLITAGSFGMWGNGLFLDWYELVDTTQTPLWLISLIIFFAVGIPFFVLLILGLKMLISNLKSIGTPAKIALLIIWIAAVIGLIILGIRQASQTAVEGEFTITETLPIKKGDTLNLAMSNNNEFDLNPKRRGDLSIKYDNQDQKIIYSTNIRLIVRSTTDSIGKLIVVKQAESHNFLDAKKLAEAIDYKYQITQNNLILDPNFTTPFKNKYRDQKMEVIVYLPEGSVLFAHENTNSYHLNYSNHQDILNDGEEDKYLLIEKNKTTCLNCEIMEAETYIDSLQLNQEINNNENWEKDLNQKIENIKASKTQNNQTIKP